MAYNLNRVQLIGHLAADPEWRVTDTQHEMTSFRLATNKVYYTTQGPKKVREQKTEWHSCLAWGKLAKIIYDHLTKGQMVFVEGELETSNWEDDKGKHSRTTIVAHDVILLERSTPTEEAEESQE